MIAGRKLVAALVCAGVTFGAGASAALGAVRNVRNGNTFATIQAAINDAGTVNGDTIVADAGTYPEQVTVNKSLVLEGPQHGVDARTRSGAEAVVDGTTNSGKTPFDVTVNNVTIDGFTVQGGTNATTFGTNILLGSGTSGETIQNDIIQGGITGLFLGSHSSTIRQNLIRNNNASGPTSGDGIYTDQFDAGGPLAGDTIDSNSFVNNQNAAIDLASTNASDPDSSFTISNNTFTSDGNAVLALNLTGSTITGNVFASSLGSQVVLAEGVSNVTASHNSIQNGATNGVRVFNEGTGAPAATGITLACNSITGNSTSGLTVDHSAYTGTLAASYNWWGSATGPTNSANPGGTGQAIVEPDGNVSFKPFLIDGTDVDPSTPGFQCEGLSIANVTAHEASAFAFAVTLSNPSPTPVTVDYATADGTAQAGRDYGATSGTLTFAPGQLTKTIDVQTIQDNGTGEPDETFNVQLSSPSGATLTQGAGVGTIQDVAAPSTSITTPAADATFAVHQVVNSSFSCIEGTNGPGLASCVDQANRATAAAVDTSTTGSHVFTVTATSQSGRTATASVSYTVAAPPSVSVSSPVSGRRYALGQRVPASFSCSEGAFGPGLASCTGSAANGAPIDTRTLGTHTFAVKAISLDGQSAKRTLTYAVLSPPVAVLPEPHRQGSFIVAVKLAGPGGVDVLITAAKRDLATAAALLQPAKGQFVFARAHAVARGPRTLRITVTPNANGRRLVAHRRQRVALQLSVTFTPNGGPASIVGRFVLHLPGRRR